jgi:DNA-binding transcriptional regulator YhcF (GntR family)
MDFSNNQAIYLQIAEMICEKILLGQFREDERIPSVRENGRADRSEPQYCDAHL